MEGREYVCILLSGARYSILWRNGRSGKKNLKEVILINLEEAQKIGTLDKLLEEAGFDKTQSILALRKELVGFTPIEVAL
jgi:hypothetical protein